MERTTRTALRFSVDPQRVLRLPQQPPTHTHNHRKLPTPMLKTITNMQTWDPWVHRELHHTSRQDSNTVFPMARDLGEVAFQVGLELPEEDLEPHQLLLLSVAVSKQMVAGTEQKSMAAEVGMVPTDMMKHLVMEEVSTHVLNMVQGAMAD